MRLNMDYSVKWLVGSVVAMVVLAVIGAVAVIREAIRILMPIIIWLDAAGR